MTAEILNIIDTHAHLDLEDFDEDREEVIRRSIAGIFPKIKGKPIDSGDQRFSIVAMILPGITAQSSERAIELAKRIPLFHPGVAIHPNYTQSAAEGDWERIERLSEEESVVAIGETGLDLYWDEAPIERQIDYLFRHIFLAKRRNLPIIIHCREAENELLTVLRDLRRWEMGKIDAKWEPLAGKKSDAFFPLRGVIHSFSGGPETASELIDLGFYLGFTGSVTFTSRKFAQIGEAAKIIPPDRFLLETDSPFLTPHPFRGKLERNEPLMTLWTARRLAELRETTVADIVTQTADNARALFGKK